MPHRLTGGAPLPRNREFMKIAQISPLMEAVPPKLYGGTERIVAYLCDELVALGHDVTLFASGDSVTQREASGGLAQGAPARRRHAGLSGAPYRDAGEAGPPQRRVRHHPSACRLSRLSDAAPARRALCHDLARTARSAGAAAALSDSSTTLRSSRSRIPSASRCRRRTISPRSITACPSGCCCRASAPAAISPSSAGSRRRRRPMRRSASPPRPA